jgi:hypothetical protein
MYFPQDHYQFLVVAPVHTLKNLISQDETLTADSNQKSKLSPMPTSNSSYNTVVHRFSCH